jgi:hypothetical protein
MNQISELKFDNKKLLPNIPVSEPDVSILDAIKIVVNFFLI